MKTVPRNVQVVTQDQAARVADLPGEVSLALADIAVVARKGLLATSVAAGMAVMQTMFEAKITAVAGPKGKHNPGRVRRGTATQIPRDPGQPRWQSSARYVRVVAANRCSRRRRLRRSCA